MLALSTFFLSQLSLTKGKAILAFYWNLSCHVALLNINTPVYTGSLYEKKCILKDRLKSSLTIWSHLPLQGSFGHLIDQKITSQD